MNFAVYFLKFFFVLLLLYFSLERRTNRSFSYFFSFFTFLYFFQVFNFVFFFGDFFFVAICWELIFIERTPVGCERHNESGMERLVGLDG